MLDTIQEQETPSSDTGAETKHHQGIVIYSDGSARPTNPGNIGWGVHGYLYTTEPTTRGTGLATQVLTANGYVPSSQKAKVSHDIVQPIQYFDFFGSSEIVASNNAAEVDALYFALEKIKTYDVKVIQVYTDSEYLRRGLTEWVRGWIGRGWKKDDGSPIPNAFHWERLLKEWNDVHARGVTIDVNWVKGHADNFGNIIADKLATIGVIYSMNAIRRGECAVSPAGGYWKSEVVRHPFIHYKRLYFNSVPEFNVSGHYYIAEPGGDDFVIGKRMPETSYCVLRLKEPDVVLETIKERQYAAANTVNSIMHMRLDKVYSPDVYPYLDQHGQYAILPDNRSLMGLSFIDKKPITVEMNSAVLSLRAVESFDVLEELLTRYTNYRDMVEDTSIERCSFQVHDLTETFYNYEEKTKRKETVTECTLKPMFGVGFKDLMVDVTINHNGEQRTIKVPLILGADILPRNSLKRIESMHPKVSLLTWKESNDSIRYACVVEVDSGIGIWSNFYADKIYLS